MDVVWGGDPGWPRRRLDAAEYTRRPIDRKLGDGYDRSVRRASLILGVLLIASGAVWAAQGLSVPFAPRSFMTADRAWIVIGATAVLGGALLVGWAARRGS